MRKLYIDIPVVLGLIAAMVPAARARQNQSDQPIPAYRSPLASAADNGNGQDADGQDLGPDTRPLTGAQNFSLGTPGASRGYLQPSFNLSSTADSNAQQTNGATGWTTWTTLSAGLDFHRQSGTSNMSLKYLAGGMLSNNGAATNGLIQGVSFQDKRSFRRSTLSFVDTANYLPESQFGFGGLGGVQLPGIGALGGNFTPGQTAFTARGKNLTNSTVVELDELLTARTTLTFVGGYSLLHSYENGLFNYSDATFQGGYNHQMSPKNTIGLSYLFSAFRFSNSSQSIDTNTVTGSFGRRITGRLAFQASGGPQVVFSQLPIAGNPTQTGTSSTPRVYWSAQSALQYKLQSTGLAVTYIHGVAGGGGVLPGAVADTVSGSIAQQLTRTTNGVLNFGYSRNSGINQGTGTPLNQSYDSSYGGVTLNRVLGRMLNVNLSYQAQYQTTNVPTCVGPTCGAGALRHLITLGVGWQRQPTRIE